MYESIFRKLAFPYAPDELFYFPRLVDQDPIEKACQAMQTRMIVKPGATSLAVELPGFDTKDVSIEVEDGILRITAKSDSRELNKTVTLPTYVDVDSMAAELKFGLLTVTLPCKSASKKIEVK